MQSGTFFDNLIHNLKVVGAVHAGGRVNGSVHGTLYIIAPGIRQTLHRTITGDSRTKACTTIQVLLNTVSDFTELLKSDVRDVKKASRLNNLLTALQECVQGIESLQQTYSTDVSTKASLQMMFVQGQELIATLTSCLASCTSGCNT